MEHACFIVYVGAGEPICPQCLYAAAREVSDALNERGFVVDGNGVRHGQAVQRLRAAINVPTR